MTAYLILNYDVSDPERLAHYRQLAAPALVGPDGGELLATTPETLRLEEGGEAGSHTVVIRFDDRDHALRTYHSPSYQAVIGDRLAATVPRFAMIVEGVSGTAAPGIA